MTSREAMLRDIRRELGRDGAAPTVPEVRLRPRVADRESLITEFLARVEGVGGTAVRVPDEHAAEDVVQRMVGAGKVVRQKASREECAAADFGVTGSAYALADTGTLVMLAGADTARLASLLPPVHIAVVPAEHILSGLDELFTRIPRPAEVTSSLVFITGPSRTGDIELELVRGVHGPGELHVIVVG